MTIEPRVLGIPGQDNAVYMRVDSGQAIYHLLFDCGEGCIYPLGRSVLQEIDHLFFSHAHMDHPCFESSRRPALRLSLLPCFKAHASRRTEKT